MSEISKYIIYGLHEEGLGEIRYIGRSSSGLGRPKEHFKPRSYKRNYPVNSWIKNVVMRNSTVVIRVLASFDAEEFLNDAEIALIAKYRGLGHRLTNVALGGGGFVGNVPWNKGLKDCYELDVIEQMSAAKKGKKWSIEKRNEFKETVRRNQLLGKNRMGCNLSKPVRCIPDGIDFPSVKAASRYFGYTEKDIKKSASGKCGARSKVKADGREFQYLEPNKALMNGYYMNAVVPGPNGWQPKRGAS